MANVDFNIVTLDINNEDIIVGDAPYLYRYKDICYYNKYVYTKKQLLDLAETFKDHGKAERFRDKIKELFLGQMPRTLTFTPQYEMLEATYKAAEYGHLKVIKYLFKHYEFTYSDMVDMLYQAKEEKVKKYLKARMEEKSLHYSTLGRGAYQEE